MCLFQRYIAANAYGSVTTESLWTAMQQVIMVVAASLRTSIQIFKLIL